MTTVTLTFDNGPHREGTPHVLDVLDRHGVKATFFVVGEQLDAPGGRDLAAEAASRGHWIGNHTLTHRTPLGELTDKDEIVTEIQKAEALLGDLAHPDRLFRPFGGGGHLDQRLLSPEAVAYLTARNYTCVLWNCVPGDWADPDGWVETALQEIESREWSLVVLHDAVPGAMAHLDRFLTRLREAGATFRQDFPEDCVPIRRGTVTADMTPYVRERAER